MPLKTETKELQSKLAEFCKTGEMIELKGAKHDRLHHYRRLTYNILKDSLSTAYPIAKKTLSENEWKEMIDSYYKEHKMQSPQVWKMPEEFYYYCVNKDYQTKFERPYLNELLFFEWVEIDLHTQEDELIPKFREEGDMLEDRIVMTPEHHLLSFEYPIHKMRGNELLDNKGNYFVLMFRKTDTGGVKFINISSFFALLLQNLIDGEGLLEESTGKTAETFGVDKDKALQHSIPFINDLFLQGFMIGYTDK
ncbi:MAG: DUF2063 domain-containing protein [Chlorobiota bacterium]